VHRYENIRFGFPGQIKEKNTVRIEKDFSCKKRRKIRFESTMISAANKEEKYG
jgi:hypothetical protein